MGLVALNFPFIENCLGLGQYRHKMVQLYHVTVFHINQFSMALLNSDEHWSGFGGLVCNELIDFSAFQLDQKADCIGFFEVVFVKSEI